MQDLQAFAENVLVVAGPPVRLLGITLTTRMIIVKLADGSLWLSPGVCHLIGGSGKPQRPPTEIAHVSH